MVVLVRMYSVFNCSTVLHYPLVLVPRYGSPAVLVLYDHDYDRYNRDYDYANSSDLRSDHDYDHRDHQWLATVTMTTSIPVLVLVTTATTTVTNNIFNITSHLKRRRVFVELARPSSNRT